MDTQCITMQTQCHAVDRLRTTIPTPGSAPRAQSVEHGDLHVAQLGIFEGVR